MMIKEEKILSNIYKVKKLINPNSKKQIIKNMTLKKHKKDIFSSGKLEKVVSACIIMKN